MGELMPTPHQHDFKFAYAKVEPGCCRSDEDGYMYDVLYCRTCGTPKQMFTGQMRFWQAQQEVDDRNKARGRN